MAKAGVYKSEVKRARDTLLAQGLHPSIDAVRVALGNTGSKTTIHKYLKELEEEDGGAGMRRASISEALQDLVERLADRLQEEAQGGVDAMRDAFETKEREHASELVAARHEITQLSAQLLQVNQALQTERQAHVAEHEAAQREAIARHTAEQQVADLKERLAENEAHRQSLEDKHRHAREALDHYRESVKDQREQDIRRHEQQLQQLQVEMRAAQQTIVVKQDDITRLNQEGARLVAELSHVQKALYDEQTLGRRNMQRLDELQPVMQRAATLATQLAERDAQILALQQQMADVTGKADTQAAKIRELELALVQSRAAVEAQQGIAAELRAYLDAR